MAIGGRPKEEGGHKPLKISVNKFVRDALEKVGNKSQFLEKVAQPILEKMDPGEGSLFLWRIDVFISQGIIKAAQKRDFKQVETLGWLADCLEDARKLSHVPPANYKTSLFETSFNDTLKENFLKALGEVIVENVYGNPFKARDLITNLKNLAPPKFKKIVNPNFVAAEKAYDKRRYRDPFSSAIYMKTKIVPFLIDKFSSLLYEIDKLSVSSE